MPKRKILVVTELYPYPGNIYLGTFVTQQLDILKNYYDVTVLTVYPESLHIKKRQPPYTRQENGLTIVSVPYYPWWIDRLGLFKVPFFFRTYMNKLLVRRLLYRAAKKLHAAMNFELVHGHETYIGDEAGPISQMLGIPSVFTLHSFYYFHQKIFGTFVTKLALKNLQLCSHYICVSSIAAESYIHQGLSRDKFSIIPNGVNPTQKTQPSQKITDFANGRKVLLSVGYLADDKRVDICIRTLSELPTEETVLVIAGIGPNQVELKKLSATLRCADRILWLGSVAPSLMPEVYQASDIIVHPSVIDSFSMVCLEAMAQGKVVICTTLIGICEFTKNGVNIIYVPPDDVASIVTKIQRLFSHPDEYTKIADQAYNFGKTMTWDHQVEKIRKVYEQLMTTK